MSGSTGSAWLALVALLASVPGSGCRQPNADREPLAVFAAASLRAPFAELAADFRRAHPDLELTFNFAGSQELRTQIEHGAAADVLASADHRHMQELSRQGLVRSPVTFVRNQPVIVLSAEAGATIRTLADLPRARRIVVAAPEVPIGRYTLEALTRAQALFGARFRTDVEARVVSREPSVTQVLTKVRLGEADAGFVYRSDAQGAPELRVIELPSEVDVVAEYPIAIVSETPRPELARAWVELVLSAHGQALFERAGFTPRGTEP